MMLIDFNLSDYYKTSMRLQKDFGFDLIHMESLYPFEYKIYVAEVLNYIEEEKKRQEKSKGRRG